MSEVDTTMRPHAVGLRERRSGTMERLMDLPTSKFGLLVGYAVATLMTRS